MRIEALHSVQRRAASSIISPFSPCSPMKLPSLLLPFGGRMHLVCTFLERAGRGIEQETYRMDWTTEHYYPHKSLCGEGEGTGKQPSHEKRGRGGMYGQGHVEHHHNDTTKRTAAHTTSGKTLEWRGWTREAEGAVHNFPAAASCTPSFPGFGCLVQFGEEFSQRNFIGGAAPLCDCGLHTFHQACRIQRCTRGG